MDNNDETNKRLIQELISVLMKTRDEEEREESWHLLEASLQELDNKKADTDALQTPAVMKCLKPCFDQLIYQGNRKKKNPHSEQEEFKKTLKKHQKQLNKMMELFKNDFLLGSYMLYDTTALLQKSQQEFTYAYYDLEQTLEKASELYKELLEDPLMQTGRPSLKPLED